MSFLQLRINYSDNNSTFYRAFAWPLQQWLAQHHFHRWSIGRGWQNGPHYVLTFDTGTPFFSSQWTQAITERAEAFLRSYPSPPVDHASQVALQTRLNQIEAAGIDPDVVEPNNSVRTVVCDAASLAAKYESVTQWLSVFNMETDLRKAVLAHWMGAGAGDGERFAFDLMVLLACVYPPAPSSDPDVFEYNGFLSFHSNYLFWHHTLAPEQQREITRRFETGYAAKAAAYRASLIELEMSLGQAGHPIAELGQLLVAGFRESCRLAQDGVIHARSPFPPNRLANKDGVSSFHQKYFYENDGQAKAFGLEFCGYRWLLNVVYRTLPLLGVSPMTRQMLNYSLDRLQQERAEDIRRIRAAMLMGDAQQEPQPEQVRDTGVPSKGEQACANS
jgi:hypothetical protein